MRRAPIAGIFAALWELFSILIRIKKKPPRQA